MLKKAPAEFSPFCHAHVRRVRSSRQKGCGFAGRPFLNISLVVDVYGLSGISGLEGSGIRIGINVIARGVRPIFFAARYIANIRWIDVIHRLCFYCKCKRVEDGVRIRLEWNLMKNKTLLNEFHVRPTT